MKRIINAFTACDFSLLVLVINEAAQTAESIWLTANTTAYKTGETVIIAFNASSATPIQGFTFQIRYDPSCLKPVNASSPIPGMNGLPLPQLTGLVDGSYASTTPQAVNGILAEVRFTALKGCQTGLYLEYAVLVIRDAEGFAKPLSRSGRSGNRMSPCILTRRWEWQILPSPNQGSILPLEPPKADQGFPLWSIGIVAVFLVVLLIFGVYKFFRIRKSYKEPKTRPSPGIRRAALHIKHGPHAGKSFALNKLPVLIGRDPQNDICINDPHVISRHAQIYSGQEWVLS